MSRVESTEKENASLKYEVRVLEKELEIRNEEREFNRQTAEVAQKQHMESVKKIEKLQTECQRLRLLVQKRLPGPAALVKMKNEVEMLGKGQVDMRRRRSNPSLISSMDFHVDLAADDAPSKRINFLNEQLHKVEEENRSLKHALNMKSSKHLSRTISARTTPRLSREEGQDGELLKDQTAKESGKYPFSLQEHSLATLSDMGSDDKASCAESWASALLSELEHFKNEKQLSTPSHRNMETADMNLMDDFAEMEKLAEASADCPAGGPRHSPEVSGHVFQTTPNKSLDVEAFDIGNDSKISTTEKSDQKFQSIVSISIQKILELLEGINIISQENGVAESLTAKDVEVLPCKISADPSGYMVRVFQWKTDELSAVLKQFVQTCNDLLNGKADLQQFAQLVASNLEWLMNHCFSLQDVSSMRDAIRSHLDWNESKSESEIDSGSANHSTESSQPHIEREDISYPPMVSPLNGRHSSSQMEELQRKQKGEAKRLNVKEGKNESLVTDLEGELPSEFANGESFRIQLKDSKDITDKLPAEMETMGQSKGKNGDEIEKQKMTKEDLETQLTETNLESGQSCQKISPADSDPGNNDTSCKRLEETCNGLTAQLNSMTSKEVQDDGNPREKQLQDDWEITVASEKLAECQETILNLRKQLKALATPRDAALFDNVISTPADHVVTRTSIPEKNVSQRFSLLDKMLAEDNDQIGVSPRTTKDDSSNGNSNSVVSTSAAIESWSKFADSNGISRDAGLSPVVSMAIVPCKKKGGINFWKKLFWRHKNGNSKKAPFSKLQ
ncbi:UNVERIFIED_CONTAM: Filament-like plant protein 7 [Sesamum radiatum]|uniref:Filament-like plant protein 7 n=1 Tax=Sesamum radiatum TaxID=300843 RepID=A0AAW2P4C5_SESRA